MKSKEEKQEYNRKWYLENKERIKIEKLNSSDSDKTELKESKRKWYLENKERLKIKKLNSSDTDKEKLKIRQRIWSLENKDRIRETRREYMRIYNKQYQIENRDRVNAHKRKWNLENKDYFKQYNETNKAKLKIQKRENHIANKEINNEISKQYYLDHIEKVRAYASEYQSTHRDRRNARKRERLKTDINFRLECNLRGRLRMAMINKQKTGSAVKDLGCSIEYFNHYIAGKFIPGMTWENYGTVWHLDHIIPLSSFNLENRDEFLKACHYTNYQPLWATTKIARAHGDMISIGNIEKGNKIS